MSIFEFLLPSVAACVVLAGIHTYLGIHVITRGGIFLDIALAQIAAFGMTVAFLVGYEPDSAMAYFFASGATLVAAVFFTLFRDEIRHQEALIGVAFAVSSAASIHRFQPPTVSDVVNPLGCGDAGETPSVTVSGPAVTATV